MRLLCARIDAGDAARAQRVVVHGVAGVCGRWCGVTGMRRAGMWGGVAVGFVAAVYGCVAVWVGGRRMAVGVVLGPGVGRAPVPTSYCDWAFPTMPAATTGAGVGHGYARPCSNKLRNSFSLSTAKASAGIRQLKMSAVDPGKAASIAAFTSSWSVAV